MSRFDPDNMNDVLKLYKNLKQHTGELISNFNTDFMQVLLTIKGIKPAFLGSELSIPSRLLTFVVDFGLTIFPQRNGDYLMLKHELALKYSKKEKTIGQVL